jgi:hypothetical protein
MPQADLSEAFSDIELTEEEKKEAIDRALLEARHRKHAEIMSKAYYEKVTAPQELRKYTSEELFNFLSATPGFVVDDDNNQIVRLLCQYFTNDPEFEKAGYKLSKGICLFGGVGVGKTMLMEMFRRNQKHSYQVTSCQDVESIYAKNGPDFNEKTNEIGLRKFFGLINLNAANEYGHRTIGYLFDDLGQEITNTKYFGTERNVMQEVLTQRYKLGLFTSTHLTTNLDAKMILDTYGPRVADRMKEMFNII